MPGYQLSATLFEDQEVQFQELCCPVCKNLLRDAVQAANCGHSFCESCIVGLLSTDSKPVCPSCAVSLKDKNTSELYHPNKADRDKVNALSMICPYHDAGCAWKGRFLQLFDIQAIETIVSKVYINIAKQISGTSLNHEESKLDSHDLVQRDRTIEDIIPIDSDSVASAVEGSTLSMGGVQDKVVTNDVTKLKEEISSLRAIVSKLEKAQGNQRGMPVEAVTNDECVRKELVSLRAKVSELEKAQGHQRGMQVEAVTNDECVRKELVSLSAKVSELEKAQVHQRGMQAEAVPCGGLQHELSEGNVSLSELEKAQQELLGKNEEIESLRAMVDNLKEQVSRLRTPDLDVTSVETNSDGTVVWKIPQFSQRMDDAKRGKCACIFSQPFYTGRGYRMCLHLYFFKETFERHSYMSLLFVLMKGEFDSRLQWPFQQKVTLKLINKSGGRNEVSDYFPDPAMSAFQRPMPDHMNMAVGFPHFINHVDLNNKDFIVDDTIVIECMVGNDTTHRIPSLARV